MTRITKIKCTDNKRNRYFPKTVKSEFSEFELDILRNSKGEFDPGIVPSNTEIFLG